MTLNDLFENYYRPLKLRSRSPSTSRLYGCTIRSYGRFLEHEPTLDDLEDLQLSRFLERRARDRSPFTAEKERTQLCSLWRFASDRRLKDTRPCVPPAVLPERIPTAWTAEQLRNLVRVAGETTGMIGTIHADVFWQCLILVLYESAERVGAVLATTVGDWGSPRLLARAEYRKGGKRDRLHTLSPHTCDLVDRLCKGKNHQDKIFEWCLSPTHLWCRFGEVVKRAGLDNGRRTKFHQLRRCAATHYAAAGGNPTALLDHSSPRTTRAYIDVRMVDQGTPACDMLPRIN